MSISLRSNHATSQHGSGMRARFHAAQTWISFALRLLLGGAWIYAGATKATHLSDSISAVFAFRLLPDEPARLIGAMLPFIEIAIGGLLIVGFSTRLSAVASSVLAAVFLIAIISAAARGLRIDCGCFGGGGDLAANQDTRYTIDIVRDSAMLAGSVFLACLPASRFALDNYDTSTRGSEELDG